MPWLWVSLFVLLQAGLGGAADSQLTTAASASPRPRECLPPPLEAEGLWTRARAGEQERYCDLLARGYARLTQDPAGALTAAEAAEALAGKRAAVQVLNGRARMRLGQANAALERFVQAELADRQAFLDPEALHDYARAASLAGEGVDAVRLYRVLASRTALLSEASEASVAQLEAAAHVLAYVPGGIDEALGYLQSAQRQAPGLSPWVAGLRMLAAERSGRGERVSSVGGAPSVDALVQPLGADSARPPLLPPGEFEALCAVLSQSKDRLSARQYRQKFVALARRENVWLAEASKKRDDPPLQGRAH